MPLFRRSPRDKLSRRAGKAVDQLIEPVTRSAVDDYFKAVLVGCVTAGSIAVETLAAAARPLSDDDPAANQWVSALDGGASLIPPIRVGTWAFVSRVIARSWGDRYDEIIGVAEAGFGIESRQERALASFGVWANDRRGWEEDAKRFDRATVRNVLESVLDRSVTDREANVMLTMFWAQGFNAGWEALNDVVGNLAPDGPPAE